MATWAKGIDFKNNSNTTRIGGVGMYGVDNAVQKIYLGFGSEPWGSTGLELTSSNLTFKGNKIYHAGDKPTPADIGAASSSHTHSYLPLSGGTITSSSFGPLIIKRSGSTNAGSIQFANDNGTLGSIGMSSSPNGGLIRWNTDTNISYNILDTSNYKTYVTPANIGAATSSHTHNYAASPSAGGAANLVYLPRVTGSTTSANYQPGANRIEMKEFGNDCSNIPSAAWYHIITGQGSDSNYNTQLALGMTTQAAFYRYRNAGTWGSWKQLAFTDSSISGNAGSATQLQTARTINGTSFNGTANITTANWGTARTITIGSTGKSVNGSGNVAWSLAEIGAAASNHTHSYLPLSGGTVSGNFIVNSSKVPALATKVSSSELFTTKITVAGDYAAWANQTALSGVIITQNGITTPGISSGAIDASGESKFFNQTYSDPWNGTSCAIKATGYIASTHSIMSKGKFILGNSPNMYGGLGYDTTSGDVYVANAVNNWLRLKSNQTMTYAGYEVFTTKDRGNIMTVATRISNLNVKLNSGWYAWSNNATGRPADYGVMLVIQWGSEGDFCQIAVSTGNSMWTRWYVNNAWTSWIGH